MTRSIHPGLRSDLDIRSSPALIYVASRLRRMGAEPDTRRQPPRMSALRVGLRDTDLAEGTSLIVNCVWTDAAVREPQSGDPERAGFESVGDILTRLRG